MRIALVTILLILVKNFSFSQEWRNIGIGAFYDSLPKKDFILSPLLKDRSELRFKTIVIGGDTTFTGPDYEIFRHEYLEVRNEYLDDGTLFFQRTTKQISPTELTIFESYVDEHYVNYDSTFEIYNDSGYLQDCLERSYEFGILHSSLRKSFIYNKEEQILKINYIYNELSVLFDTFIYNQYGKLIKIEVFDSNRNLERYAEFHYMNWDKSTLTSVRWCRSDSSVIKYTNYEINPKGSKKTIVTKTYSPVMDQGFNPPKGRQQISTFNTEIESIDDGIIHKIERIKLSYDNELRGVEHVWYDMEDRIIRIETSADDKLFDYKIFYKYTQK